MSIVEYEVNKQYGSTKTPKPIIGHWSAQNNFVYDTLSDAYLELYNLVSRYYRNSEIGFDDVETFLVRFNDKWQNAIYKIKQLIAETGDFQIGSKGTVSSKTTDNNTILHGYTDTYKRNGKNATTSNGESKSQNSVTQLEKGVSNGKSETEYGEGATTERKMNGETDTRDTVNTRSTEEITAEDIRQYLKTNFGQLFIEQFHDLFMEVYE